MFRCRNVHEFMAGALLLPKLFGMFPMNVDYTLSSAGLIRATVVFIVASTARWWTLSFLVARPYLWALSKYLDILEQCMLLVATLLCFLITLKTGARIRNVVESIDSVDFALIRLKKRVVYSCLPSYCHSVLRIFFVLVMMVEQFFNPISDMHWWDWLVHGLTLQISIIVLHFLLSPFYTLLQAFDFHFTTLKKMVYDLKIETDPAWKQKIERIVHIHIKLYHSCCIVNRIFSASTFVVISAAFITIVKNIYSICYVIIEYNRVRSKKIYYMTACATYILMWVLELCTLANYCARLTSQSIEFKDTVYEVLLDDKFEALHTNGKLKLQLAYKPVILFKACNFISVDYTLVHSMAAIAITYIVLLVQLGSGKEFKGSN